MQSECSKYQTRAREPPTIYETVQKATIHQLTTILATSKNMLFPGHYHQLTTSADASSL